jgi:hypothetical protein
MPEAARQAVAYNRPMLSALSVADALAIAEASAQRSRDERAMVDYLGIGRRGPKASLPPYPRRLQPGAADLAAFDSPERQRLHGLVADLAAPARQELIALVWLGGSMRLDFARALQRAQRMPAGAQIGYILGRRLDRHIPAGLEKLGLRA